MEKLLFCLILGLSANGLVRRSVRFVHVTHVSVTKSCAMVGFRAFPCWSQKLPRAGGECMFVSMFTFRFSFHTMAVVVVSPHFSSISCPKFFGIPFLFGLTLPKFCIVLLCKLPNNAGDNEHFVHV